MIKSILPFAPFVAAGIVLAACSSDPDTTADGGTSDSGTTTPDSGTPTPDSGTPTPDSSTPADASVAPTFTNVYANVLQGACTGCHTTGHATGLDMSSKATAYTNLVDKAAGQGGTSTSCMGKTRVTGGAPGASLLFTKIDHSAGCGNPMPLGGAKLPADKAKLVSDWIAAGARND